MLLLAAVLAATAHAAGPVTGSAEATLSGLPLDGGTFTVANPHGQVRVTCGDGTKAVLTVSWTLDGDAKTVAAVAAGMGADLVKSGSGATAGVKAPKELKTLTTHDVVLAVTLPRGGTFSVQGGNGELAVAGCTGSLTASNTRGAVSVDGRFGDLNVRAPDGKLEVKLSNNTLAKPSVLDAPKGAIQVEMPDFSADLDVAATGIQVEMPDLVTKSQTATTLVGVKGAGGATLQIRSGDKVLLR